ncbi:MAG: manganese catalase family protein [Christensenellaceae bacterium]|jgi:spore coat protein JC|nr:manganese catalase family protein [Christensenellaceae bacterium]PWM63573.1 MAG: rubrerythrin family protein [Clostridia bacterium]
MWIYQKKLEYPVNITAPDPRMAKALMAQYGGPDSELAASMRYLTQRFSMPDNRVRATCNDIGTEELAHWEMIGTMIYQCMRGASLEEIEAAGLLGYYTMHNHGVYPADPNGVPFTASYIQCTGDPIADLVEDLAAEQKARATYEHLMTLTDNPQLINPLRFLREREIVHFQRFGECLEIVQALQSGETRTYYPSVTVESGGACMCRQSN